MTALSTVPKVLSLAALLGMTGTLFAELASLKYTTLRDWDVVLPKEQFTRVSGDLAFSGVPTVFHTQVNGTALVVDHDGDGETDVKVSGKYGLVTLRGKSTGGNTYNYSMRLVNQGGGWMYAASGAAQGKIANQKVQIIDQNNNGRYNDYGKDAMIIGRGKNASFLSKVVNVRGKLFSIDVAADGSEIDFEPFAGGQGMIDMTSQFATKGKLLAAIVQSADGQHSFALSGKALEVPAGDYHLYNGRVGMGRNVVVFSKGASKSITVKAGASETVALGEPLNIDFRYVRQPGRVIMAPQLVSYVGRFGEVYGQWTPFGGSPQFDVRDMETGKQLALAVFGGC